MSPTQRSAVPRPPVSICNRDWAGRFDGAIEKGFTAKPGAESVSPRQRGRRRDPTCKQRERFGEPAMKVFTTRVRSPRYAAKVAPPAPSASGSIRDGCGDTVFQGRKTGRIPREYLIKFLKEHGMPLGDLEDEGNGQKVPPLWHKAWWWSRPSSGSSRWHARSSFAVAASGFRRRHPSRELPSGLHHRRFLDRQHRALVAKICARNSEFAEVILITCCPMTATGRARSFEHQRDVQGNRLMPLCLPKGCRTLIGIQERNFV